MYRLHRLFAGIDRGVSGREVARWEMEMEMEMERARSEGVRW